MDLGLTDDQEQLVASFNALLHKQCRSDVVRSSEPLGYDPGLWASLRDTGAIDMAAPTDAGGWGAEMLDLCLVAECLGASCAPAPVVELQVAARLLASLGEPGSKHLASLLDGTTMITLAVRPAVGGLAELTPAGAIADVVLVYDGDSVLAVAGPGIAGHVANHGALPLADVLVQNGEVLATGRRARECFDAAVDDWLLLTAASLVGIAAKALDLAVEYAKEREAFGVAIGSFQAIAHRLADAATSIDGARLLVHEAAWANDRGLEESAERSAMAFGFAAEVARSATYWAVHTFGGYGVMLEYDAQLYFRRARGWAGVFGDADAAYLRVTRVRHREGT
jgi:alkylation response protein AidB-like acyl-CoA dehydrogenase